MNLKQLRFNVKSLDDSAGEGVFSGYASTFGNKDLQGDVIAKGAFAETLEKDYAGGAGIPIHWNHQDGKPTDIIGRTLSAVEDEKGLLISAQLDIEDNPTAQQAYDLLKDGRVHQMSIGFVPTKTAWITEKGDGPWGRTFRIPADQAFRDQRGAGGREPAGRDSGREVRSRHQLRQ